MSKPGWSYNPLRGKKCKPSFQSCSWREKPGLKSCKRNQHFVNPHLPEAFWRRKTKTTAGCRSVRPFYFAATLTIPTDAKQSDGFRTSERACAQRSTFLYSPALAQPDLRARPQHTRPHRCRDALLSAGRSPRTHPLLPKQEETFVERLIWFTHFENRLEQNNKSVTERY